jgi:hypothetical protein
MKTTEAVISGTVGAVALNVLHETARQLYDHAPRMDVIGMRALAQSMRAANQSPPPRDTLYWLTLAGDVISNGLYYSLVGLGKQPHVWRRGIMLGLLAGVGAVALPQPLGLGRQPSARFPVTQILTVLWYLIGGIVAAATARQLAQGSTS